MSKKIDLYSFATRLILLLVSILLFISTSWAGENIEVNVETSKGTALSNLNVYAFTESGSYTGVNATTNEIGTAIFDTDSFDAGNYKFRADYLGSQFWSLVITLPETLSVDVIIEEETAEVTVTTTSGPSSGVKVYLFSGSGSYLGLYETTDENGKVSFDLPVGKDFKFRADILRNQYWSDIATIVSGGINQISLNAGGGTLYVTVDKGSSIPMEGINTYLFNASGSYLGLSQTSNSSGMVEYDVPEGDYKVRADYLGYQFWSQDTTVTEDTNITLSMPHQDVVITVEGSFQSTFDPVEGIKVYLFTSPGSYMGQHLVTDSNGQVTFNLPEQPYKVRADYMAQQFWSEGFTWQNTTVDIPMADGEITVTGAGQPLEGVKVYVFSGSGSYLGVNDTTNADGKVIFRLPAGSYNFRADYQGSQYWSDVETLMAHQVNPVDISTGGGIFTLTVLKGAADPLTDVKCYLFSEAGSYLGLYDTTDTNGQVSFSLADGTYKIRVDYLGNQFWTEVYEIPTILSDEFTIPHQGVVITVEGTYQSTSDPVEGIKVYLFTSSGSYMGKYEITDISGQVTFNLPEKAYKVRADYLGQQFWSEGFTWQDTTVTIQQGIAQIHVLRGTDDVSGAKVYLFTATGSYLGWYETTNTSGLAQFLLPSGSYKFRADEGGDQKWSDVLTIISDQVNSAEINLSDEPIVTLIADPENIQIGESSTLTWTSTNAETVTIDQGIGDVELNGSMSVSPTETTTYTITAQGPGGSATDTATVTVIKVPADVDLGIDQDEQPGGGGLVGETIRVLNGNTIDSRSDLQFSSPNQLGLTLQAFYNSRSDTTGSMGYGWTHTYEIYLDPSFDIGGDTFLKIIDGTGRGHYFSEESAGEYSGVFAEKSRVVLDEGEYIWYRLDGSRFGFSATGQLLWMDDPTGNTLVLAYDEDNLLETVTDTSGGRVLTFTYNADDLMDHVTGPVSEAVSDGIWVSYGYDTNNNLISATYPDGSGFEYYYTDSNDIHNLTQKEDKAGHVINTWSYDDNDRTVSSFSRDGKGVDIVYTSDTQVDVTDAYGKEREYLLDYISGRNRVSAIINGPGGAGAFPWSTSNAVSWIYDEDMNPLEVEYSGGTINQYLYYDERGNPQAIKLALGEDEQRVIDYTYHPDMNTPLTRTEPSVLGSGDKQTIWDYDDDYDSTPNEAPTALVSQIIEKGYTRDEAGSTVTYEYITTFNYNSKGQVLSIDGPLPGTGDITSFSYDPANGDLLSITRPVIGATTFSDYDAAGQVGMVTDVNNRTKSFTYDARGRVTVITNNADSSTSSVVYNTAGLPETRTDEDGVITGFEYDAVYGRLYKRFDHEGNYIEYGYDDQGNVIEKGYYDPANTRTNRKRFLYQDTNHDMPGLLFREINADDTYTRYGYDLEGNVASVTDPNGNTTTYSYDALNRLVIVTQPGSVVTSYSYDIHGNLISVTDAEAHTTTYQYDDMGRLVSTTSPDTGTVTYAYDEAGNPVNKTDAKAISVDYSYDLLNRLTDIHFPDPTQDIAYTYDTGVNGIGRRTGMIDESGTLEFGYDDRGRLTEKTSIIEGITYDIFRTYTPGGRVSSITYPSGRTIDYNRPVCACRVDSITTNYDGNTDTLMENLTYRPFGGASGMDTGAGGIVSSEYDESGRVITSNPGATHERTYTYDNNGNLTSISSPSTPYYNRVYEYDSLNRLIHAEMPWKDIDYTYDDVGNRLTEGIDDDSYTYSYIPGTNIIDTVTDTDTIIYTHDANGNIISIGNKILTYNQNNRLISVEENSVILGEYTYSGLGQRIIKEVDGATTIFHYDFDGNIIGESNTSGNFSKEYLYRGSSRLALVDVETGELYYYGNDRLGTPQILTDSTNTVVWEAVFDAFGDADINPNSTVVSNFRFPGQYYDQETELHYNWFRFYDPKTERYLRPDPLEFDGGDINLYGYCLNNPNLYIDSSGTDVWFFGIGVSGFISNSPKPESKRGRAIQGSIGIAFDTQTKKFRFFISTGEADPCVDIVQGIGLGIGPIMGSLTGGIDDFFGWARERTSYYGIASVTDIRPGPDEYGIAISAGGKGFGIGYTSIKTYTEPLTNVYMNHEIIKN
jgi:RHS repeat-associated protein